MMLVLFDVSGGFVMVKEGGVFFVPSQEITINVSAIIAIMLPQATIEKVRSD